MSKSFIQNTANNSIYYYIKNTNIPLYEVIKSSGAKHYFMKSNITFLMPNSVLLNKIISSKPKDSLNMLKQLLLIGTINNLSEFSRSIYNLYEFKLDNPSGLMIKIDTNWPINKYCSVFLYDGNDVPVSSKMTLSQKKSTTKSSPNMDYKLQKHKDVVARYNKYIKKGSKGINPFVMEIANILNIIKSNESLYQKVCDLMDNNAIITWFIIMQLGLEDNSLLSNELFKLKTIEHPNPYAEYNEAFEHVKPTVNGQNWFKNVSTIRKRLVNYFDISLPEQILNAYENNYLKLLQDEIRFRYRDSNSNGNLINELELIDWNYPQNHIIFGNEELCNYLINDDEQFYSGPVSFVKSIYFMYRPLNKKFYLQLVEKTKKSCDNPYENGIVYGSEGDRQFNSTSPKEERRGYNVKSVWNSLNELEKEQIREFSQISKTRNKEDIKNLWTELSDEQKEYIRELSSQ